MSNIPDSGLRTEFPSGAVRDRHVGKGRCDLLPLDTIGDMTTWNEFFAIVNFQTTGKASDLRDALTRFSRNIGKIKSPIKDTTEDNFADLLLSVAHRFEDGAIKYGDNNWRKGIPCSCYIDSAVRHYLKWRRGDTDENHADAFAWNILCCIWTAQNMPELNEYAKGVQK